MGSVLPCTGAGYSWSGQIYSAQAAVLIVSLNFHIFRADLGRGGPVSGDAGRGSQGEGVCADVRGRAAVRLQDQGH